MKSRLPFSLVACAVLLTLPSRAEEATNTIKFSDPNKPGTVKISLGRGELSVRGADTQEVSVKSDIKPAARKPRSDGLRELTAAASFSVVEKDNVVTLNTSNDWNRSGGANVSLVVPRSTTIIVQNAWGGDIACSNLTGDIEINSMQGEIRLEDVGGGAVVSTMNGQIRASIRELRDGKPLSFTSMNGEVEIRLPESAKANVRLRTQNGAVLTDFEESALVTKTEAGAPSPRGKGLTLRSGNPKVLSADIQDAIREATQASATAIKEALEAVKEGFEAARLEADDVRREVDKARSEIDRARRNADREHRNARDSAPDSPPAPMPAPFPPPKIAMATITGGKLVTGTLNGGGPEISVATMNGDVTLRKIRPGK
jgi:hypothetical protein